MEDEIKISLLGNVIALKAMKVRETKKPEFIIKFIKDVGAEMLTDMLWWDGKDVLIEILDPLTLSSKYIFKINFGD